MSFVDELLAEAAEIVENTETEFVPVTLGKRQVGVRFLPMMGADWNDLTAKHPPRSDVPRDLRFGYNIDAVVAAYPDVVLVNGDEIDDMQRTDAEGNTLSKWPAVWQALTAQSRKDVAASMWTAHERTPERLVDDAGKASAASRKKKRG